MRNVNLINLLLKVAFCLTVGVLVGCLIHAAHGDSATDTAIAIALARAGVKHTLPPCDAQASQLPAITTEADVPATRIQWGVKQPGKPRWFHVVDPNISECQFCLKAEALFDDPRMIAWSEAFECMKTTRIKGVAKPHYPTDIVTRADGTGYFIEEGCPADAVAYTDRLARALQSLKK